MFSDPQTNQIILIGLFGAMPIPLGLFAMWLADRAKNRTWATRLALTLVASGFVFVGWFLLNFPISKYPSTDFIFGFVLLLWLAAIGGIIGGIIDRVAEQSCRKHSESTIDRKQIGESER